MRPRTRHLKFPFLVAGTCPYKPTCTCICSQKIGFETAENCPSSKVWGGRVQGCTPERFDCQHLPTQFIVYSPLESSSYRFKQAKGKMLSRNMRRRRILHCPVCTTRLTFFFRRNTGREDSENVRSELARKSTSTTSPPNRLERYRSNHMRSLHLNVAPSMNRELHI